VLFISISTPFNSYNHECFSFFFKNLVLKYYLCKFYLLLLNYYISFRKSVDLNIKITFLVVGEYIMTRKIDKEKYERILIRLAKGETQKSIVIAEKCSYGTISAAKQWDKMGRPTTITTNRNTSTNRTKIVVSLPNFWLERLNEDIVAGVWSDYSDAVIDIIRTYFRTRTQTEDIRIKSPAISKQPHGLREKMMSELQSRTNLTQRNDITLRGEVMGELKDLFSYREHFKTYAKDDDSIPKKRALLGKERKEEFIKEKERIFSIFKDQKPESYIFKNYHGVPLIEEEYDALIELEQQVGEIPKWEGDFTRGDYPLLNIKTLKFSYVLLGNHVIMLNLCDKDLNYLPESISQLKFLQTLDLRNNNLTELPESIGKLEFLEELILHDNALKSIPESIGNLKNLGLLHLDNNNLTTLPDSICNLKTWAPIGLTNNKIDSLSEKILKYYKYWVLELDLVGNPILDTLEIKRNSYETKLWKIRMKEKKREKLNQKND
jgi:Leucine-rich repeat (LRR) protein